MRLRGTFHSDILVRYHGNPGINEAGHIVVKNLSAYWIPEIKVEREMHGTVYTVTGSFEGNELLEKKLTRILLKNVEDVK